MLLLHALAHWTTTPWRQRASPVCCLLNARQGCLLLPRPPLSQCSGISMVMYGTTVLMLGPSKDTLPPRATLLRRRLQRQRLRRICRCRPPLCPPHLLLSLMLPLFGHRRLCCIWTFARAARSSPPAAAMQQGAAEAPRGGPTHLSRPHSRPMPSPPPQAASVAPVAGTMRSGCGVEARAAARAWLPWLRSSLSLQRGVECATASPGALPQQPPHRRREAAASTSATKQPPQPHRQHHHCMARWGRIHHLGQGRGLFGR
jgi:hypothetical protein